MQHLLHMVLNQATSAIWNFQIKRIGNKTEWSAIQWVIGGVIWNYKHDYPWTVRHKVLSPITINSVNNKMRETFWVNGWKRAVKI